MRALLGAIVNELADVVELEHAVKMFDFARKQDWHSINRRRK